MLQSYPTTDVEKKVLNYRPHQNHCLPHKELDNIQHLSGTVVFLWLINGYGFWYHIQYVQNNTLIGHVFARDRWQYYPVSIQSISSYY